MPVEKLIAQVEALPFSDDAKEHILYNNAKTFYEHFKEKLLQSAEREG